MHVPCLIATDWQLTFSVGGNVAELGRRARVGGHAREDAPRQRDEFEIKMVAGTAFIIAFT